MPLNTKLLYGCLSFYVRVHLFTYYRTVNALDQTFQFRRFTACNFFDSLVCDLFYGFNQVSPLSKLGVCSDRILGRNPDKSRVFLLAIHSTSTALPWDFYVFKLTQALAFSSNSHNLLCISTVPLLYTDKERGGKPDRKPYPLPNDLRNPYRNLKSENSQDYAQKPERNCTFMNSA